MGLNKITPALAALLLSTAALPAFAQSTTVFTSVDAVDDNVDAIEERIQDEFDDARDSRNFGRGAGMNGAYGSVSATVNATDIIGSDADTSVTNDLAQRVAERPARHAHVAFDRVQQ